MSTDGHFTKDPDANLDYEIDWTPWLQTGETISTSTWTAPAGIGKGTDSKTSSTTTVWLSGGTLDQRYRVTNHITTSQARTADRSLVISIRQM